MCRTPPERHRHENQVHRSPLSVAARRERQQAEAASPSPRISLPDQRPPTCGERFDKLVGHGLCAADKIRGQGWGLVSACFRLRVLARKPAGQDRGAELLGEAAWSTRDWQSSFAVTQPAPSAARSRNSEMAVECCAFLEFSLLESRYPAGRRGGDLGRGARRCPNSVFLTTEAKSLMRDSSIRPARWLKPMSPLGHSRRMRLEGHVRFGQQRTSVVSRSALRARLW